MDVEVDLSSSSESGLSGGDLELYNTTDAFIRQAKEALNGMENYKPCAESIRRAISNPKDADLQRTAFEEVFHNVRYIKGVHALTAELADIVKRIGHSIAPGPESNIAAKQALTKLLADLLVFALDFDQKKMMTPALQNDFAFYKRSLSKNATHPDLPITENEANVISMFIAHANPITKSLKTLEGPDGECVKRALMLLANACSGMVLGRKVEGEKARHACRVMTEAIVLYDHLGFPGAFTKGGDIGVRYAVRAVEALAASEANQLKAQLRYNTVTFGSGAPSVVRYLED